ncbi:MAG: DNA methyltransferase [Gammaproteobacteria bacterium]
MVKPGTIFTGDNLPILRGMDSDSVDLIYLDPPFNSNRNYAAPIGSAAAGAEFKDTWTLEDTDDAWWGEIADAHPALYKVIDAAGAAGGNSDKAYCIYMAVRLLEMQRVLKSTGSIYYHCDPVMSHSVKLMMDSIFGAQSFRNEVIWHYKNASRGKKLFAKSHEVLFWYSKSDAYTFNRDAILAPFESGMTEWRYSKGGQSGAKIPKGKTPDDVFVIPSINTMAKERQGYPTQKPLALLMRIIQANSNKSDLVLDPFCGCATACVAAEHGGRDWIGIDISPKAYDLTRLRFDKELGLIDYKFIHRTDIPTRADQQKRSKNIKHIRFGEQQGKCNGCLFEFQFRNFEVDHIIPLNEGGADSDENLQLLCGSCNRIKGKRAMAYLKAQLRKMGVIK